MKAFLILEDGHVFTGTSIGAAREVISEIVFNTSMTGYLEVMTDPSYAGQAVCMTYNKMFLSGFMFLLLLVVFFKGYSIEIKNILRKIKTGGV